MHYRTLWVLMYIVLGCEEIRPSSTSGDTLDSPYQHTDYIYDTETVTEPDVPTSIYRDTVYRTTPSDEEADDTPDTTTITEDTFLEDTDTLHAITMDRCLEETLDLEACIQCCDCGGSLECTQRETCRKQCETINFKQENRTLIIEPVTPLGKSGDYLDCFMRGEEGACKTCCDCSVVYRCGDLPYCHAACENMF